MEWSQEKVCDFIEEYRALEVLWNIRLPEYKNNKAKLDAHQKLSQKFNCDVAFIKKKIKNLRTSFRREHKNMTEKKSGSSGSKKNKWFAYDLLLFLRDVETPRTGFSSEVDDVPVSGDEVSRYTYF